MSSFLEIVDRAPSVLERNGRVSLRALQRELDLDDEAMEKLLDIQRVATREGRALAWAGSPTASPTADAVPPLPPERAPRDYTPKHLAQKILQSKSTLEGERKQVTVLVADVKGSMELAEQVDAARRAELRSALDVYTAIGATGHLARIEGALA